MLIFRIVRIALLVFFNICAVFFLLPLAIGMRIYHLINPPARKKIFIGLQEISNNIFSIADCLSENGFRCDILIIENDFYKAQQIQKNNLRISYLENKNTFSSLLTELSLVPRFMEYFFRNDYFLFIWNKTFMFLSIDLLLLKLAGKKLILMHCGDDVRYRPLQKLIDKTYGLDTWVDDDFSFRIFRKNFYYQWLSEWSGSTISTRDQATFQSGKLFHFQFPQKKLMDVCKTTNAKCTIIHCPSNRTVKRTDLVLEAVDKLWAEGLDFDFELIENRENTYVLEKLLSADILIDQPGVWVARLAVEAMASGCCVIGGNHADYMRRYDSPVIQFEKSADSLAFELRNLILEKEYRQGKMQACYDYWNNHYSYASFGKYFEAVTSDSVVGFFPIKDQKDIILQKDIPFIQRKVIELFYNPRYRSN